MNREESFKNIKWISVIGLPLLMHFFWGSGFFPCLGLGVFIFFLFKFFDNLGRKIEIREIVVLMCALQWVIGAILAYKYVPGKGLFMYYMAVPEAQYMEYVVPGLIFYIVGLYLPFYKTQIDHSSIKNFTSELLEKHPNLDLYLIFSGILAGYLSRYAPRSWDFVFFLAENLRYIGLFYLLLSRRKRKAVFVILILGSAFLTAARQAMFGNLVLWLIYTFIVFCFIYDFSARKKLLLILVGCIALFSLQTVKLAYRSIVWKGGLSAVESGKLLADMIVEKYSQEGEEHLDDFEFYMFITRINQGWIIARIMDRVPLREPYANGETIDRSIRDSLLPRFLNPGKMVAGGSEYFSRFTGRKLQGTSMDLSPIGEAYANYGKYGGWFCMFFFGLLYNIILFFVYKKARSNPTIFLWVPIIFLLAIKAETAFYMVINHLVKASFFVIIVFYFLNKFYPHPKSSKK